MAMPDRNGGAHMVAVSLTSVDIKIRRRFGKRLYEAAVDDRDLMLALEISNAVERPSDRVYWLSEAAVRKVLG